MRQVAPEAIDHPRPLSALLAKYRDFTNNRVLSVNALITTAENFIGAAAAPPGAVERHTGGRREHCPKTGLLRERACPLNVPRNPFPADEKPRLSRLAPHKSSRADRNQHSCARTVPQLLWRSLAHRHASPKRRKPTPGRQQPTGSPLRQSCPDRQFCRTRQGLGDTYVSTRTTKPAERE